MHCYTGCLRVMEWGSSFYAAYIVTGGQNVSSKCEPLDMKCDMSDGFDTDKSPKKSIQIRWLNGKLTSHAAGPYASCDGCMARGCEPVTPGALTV